MVTKIVIDTNVLVAALKSKGGASHKLLTLLGEERFRVALSVPLICEYEEVPKRFFSKLGAQQIETLLDYIASISEHTKISYLWRPILNDPKDEIVMELAVAANADYIITYNKRDFKETIKFGVQLATPKELLQMLKVIK